MNTKAEHTEDDGEWLCYMAKAVTASRAATFNALKAQQDAAEIKWSRMWREYTSRMFSARKDLRNELCRDYAREMAQHAGHMADIARRQKISQMEIELGIARRKAQEMERRAELFREQMDKLRAEHFAAEAAEAAEGAVEVAETERRNAETTLQQVRGQLQRQGNIIERAAGYLDNEGVPDDRPLDDRVLWYIQNKDRARRRSIEDRTAVENGRGL